MRFGVLGPLEVRTGDDRLVRIPELKVRALLAVLLAHEGRPVSADRLVEDLWGDGPPAKPGGALRVKAAQLRRALEDAEPGGRELVRSLSSGYLLAADADQVDARRFRDLTARARAAGDDRSRASLLTDALALWRGPAFADFAAEPFAQGPVGRLEEQRLAAMEDLAEARLALGEHNAMVGELDDLAAEHPLRERLQALLMRALYRAGRQHDALAVYRRLRERLRDDLGLDPGPEAAALHQAILEQDPALRGPAAAVPLRTRLPVPVTELVGRAREVAELRDLLVRARLVTLTGPGGVGKTRLALEAAARSAEAFPDGIVLAELAALPHDTDSPDAVAEVVAEAAGVRDGLGQAGAAGRLAAALTGRRALLVLDNCERVIEPAAKLADLLLTAGAGPHLLATGQEPLGIAGERVRPVPPLEPPPPEAAGPYRVGDLEGVASVRLFALRAAEADPGFRLDAGNAEAVATLCRRLDGVPLALELAAARVRAFGVHQLAARLDDRFDVLASGRRAAPARQRTLRAVMDWSWEPLSAPERALLRRLAVHVGGCTLEAAEQTCAGGEVRRGDVADLLARLVDRSLVVRVDEPSRPRYRLLESVAAYCLERLDEAGESDLARRRHVRYYTLLAECAEAHKDGVARRHWLARLEAEHANLAAALEEVGRRGDARSAVRMAGALAWYRLRYGGAEATAAGG
ncbi:BTAD domain-containing putative transcriptional regulator [Spirillospora sp. NPDC127200]